jgi:hypothetical protein
LGKHIVANDGLPPVDEERQLILIPKEILEVRAKRLRNKDIKEYSIMFPPLDRGLKRLSSLVVPSRL